MQRLSSSLSARTISAGLSAGLPAVKPAGRSDRRTKTVHSRRLARTENTARGNFGKQRNSVGKSRSGQSRMAEFFTGRNPQYEKRNRRYAHACRGRGCRQTRKIACRSYESRIRVLRLSVEKQKHALPGKATRALLLYIGYQYISTYSSRSAPTDTYLILQPTAFSRYSTYFNAFSGKSSFLRHFEMSQLNPSRYS